MGISITTAWQTWPVLYTIETGQRNYIQYLAVFLEEWQPGYQACASGWQNHREIEITSIETTPLFNTTAYRPRDPSCCPTIKGKQEFVAVGKKLSEAAAE